MSEHSIGNFRMCGGKHAIERWQSLVPDSLLLSHDSMFVKLSPVAMCFPCCNGLDVKKCWLLRKWGSHMQCHKCKKEYYFLNVLTVITTLCLLVCQNKLVMFACLIYIAFVISSPLSRFFFSFFSLVFFLSHIFCCTRFLPCACLVHWLCFMNVAAPQTLASWWFGDWKHR